MGMNYIISVFLLSVMGKNYYGDASCTHTVAGYAHLLVLLRLSHSHPQVITSCLLQTILVGLYLQNI